jgi:hypothetical protein
MILGLLRRLPREVYRALVAYGSQYTGLGPDAVAAQAALWPEPDHPLSGPGPAHPERMCEDVPLTPLMRALARDLEAR